MRFPFFFFSVFKITLLSLVTQISLEELDLENPKKNVYLSVGNLNFCLIILMWWFVGFDFAGECVLRFKMIYIIGYCSCFQQEKGSNEIALKAMGRAINKTVMIAELIKVILYFYGFFRFLYSLYVLTWSFTIPHVIGHTNTLYGLNFFFVFQRRIAGLHQNTSIGSTDITDMWEPLEEGLLP